MKMLPCRLALLGVVFGLAACAPARPRVAVGPLASGLEAFLATHRLAPGEEIRADEVERTAGASYHVVQVHGSERPHRHATHDLTVVVLLGRGTLHGEAAPVRLDRGDVIVIRRGTVHWFASAGRKPAVALVAFTPPLDAPDSVPASIDSLPDRR
jgi:quercetin dioxygenase-like cupin family protein